VRDLTCKFNDRKYGVHVLAPLQQPADVREALRVMNLFDADQHDEATLGKLLLDSRGAFQAINDLAKGRAETGDLLAAHDLQRSAEATKVVWAILLMVIRSRLREGYYPCLDRIASHFDVSGLPTCRASDLRAWVPPVSQATVLDLVDQGFLRMDIGRVSHDPAYIVAFNHASDFLWAVRTLAPPRTDAFVTFGRQLPGPLSLEEQLCLHNPAGKTTSETLIAEAVAVSSKWGERAFKYRFRSAAGDDRRGNLPRLNNPEHWDGELFQLVPDAWGIDLIAVFAVDNKSRGRKLHLWYGQCKMSGTEQGRIGPASGTHSADSVIMGFKRDRRNLKEFITSGHANRIVVEHKVLITCCVMSAQVRGQIEKEGIQIIDRDALASYWPDRTRSYLQDHRDTLGFLLGP
jgi:hypothetical protein